MLPKLKVLFLCTGNSCRSQMAEGWARRLQEDRIEPYSAGTRPGRIDPLAIAVMREADVDISRQRSKSVEQVVSVDFDWVITVCDQASESCPVIPGDWKLMHVGFDDPPRLAMAAKSDSEALEHYRRVRDEIREFVETLSIRLEGEGKDGVIS